MQNIPTGGTPPQNWIVPNQQGLTQFSYQALLPDYRNQRDHFPVIPSTLGEGDLPAPTNGYFTVEARQRLVRQLRNTAQRGNNRRAQNVTIEVAEHDRHRDMRLDIDNMSYEELLALEERIGNVCTGLSDEVIMRSMKQRKHLPVNSSSTSEPCCICQEEFVAGDEIGATVCEHEFHFKCIKEWLSQKNVCPICKKTALNT
ncbi:ubiquitin-protein ligase [Lithospermum erythrorhizon]|uniref:RING-type E3 ubiquitin transferase n=1 Tax=Lithospermum erythrorhizon TaxID=34254 RepID=A0AAV3PTZ9_LITER